MCVCGCYDGCGGAHQSSWVQNVAVSHPPPVVLFIKRGQFVMPLGLYVVRGASLGIVAMTNSDCHAPKTKSHTHNCCSKDTDELHVAAA